MIDFFKNIYDNVRSDDLMVQIRTILVVLFIIIQIIRVDVRELKDKVEKIEKQIEEQNNNTF